MTPYEVRLARAAARTFEKLPAEDRSALRKALLGLATAITKPGQRGSKSIKTIRGTADQFQRLRVGNYRVMYDVLEADRVIVVLGIVDRKDLERWLRDR